jgi:hypothetical protein
MPELWKKFLSTGEITPNFKIFLKNQQKNLAAIGAAGIFAVGISLEAKPRGYGSTASIHSFQREKALPESKKVLVIPRL